MKNESPETGLEASSPPDLEAPGSNDRSEDEPSNKMVLAAIAALSTEVNLIRSEVCAITENRITEVSTTIRGKISFLNENVHKSISEHRGQSSHARGHSERA